MPERGEQINDANQIDKTKELVNDLNKLNFEEAKNFIDEKVDKGESKEIAKNLKFVNSKEAVSYFVNKMVQKGDVNAMTEIVKEADRNLVNKLDSETVKSFVNKVVEKGVNNDTGEGELNLMMEVSKKFSGIANKLDSETVKSFVNKVTEKGDINSMTEIVKGANNDLADKLDSETVKSFVNKVTEKGEVNSMTEVAKKFGGIANKLDSETVKSFVNKVTEKGEINSMTQIAKNCDSNVVESTDANTWDLFANKILSMPNNEECVKVLEKNSAIMNKLSSDSKDAISTAGSSYDKILSQITETYK